jgi:hypothetical protein
MIRQFLTDVAWGGLDLLAGFRMRSDFNADPDMDPDPAFFLIADPDSGSRSRIRIQGLMT